MNIVKEQQYVSNQELNKLLHNIKKQKDDTPFDNISPPIKEV